MSLHGIAATLGIADGTVKSQLYPSVVWIVDRAVDVGGFELTIAPMHEALACEVAERGGAILVPVDPNAPEEAPQPATLSPVEPIEFDELSIALLDAGAMLSRAGDDPDRL